MNSDFGLQGGGAAPDGGTVDDRLIRARLDGALGLAHEARQYFASQGPRESANLAPIDGLAYAGESFRVTTRIAHAISWLMTQRALAKGELSLGVVLEPEHRLDGHKVCLARPREGLNLPPRLTRLLKDSERLFRRVARLDAALDQPRSRPRAGTRPEGLILPQT